MLSSMCIETAFYLLKEKLRGFLLVEFGMIHLTIYVPWIQQENYAVIPEYYYMIGNK